MNNEEGERGGNEGENNNEDKSNEVGEDTSKEEESSKENGNQERANTNMKQKEETRRRNRDNARNETGRGRSGGRGREQGGRGRGQGQEDNNNEGRPAMVSPLNPKSQRQNKGILKNGSTGGSGPSAPTGVQDDQEKDKDWIPVGSDADRANLLKQFEASKNPSGSAAGEQNP